MGDETTQFASRYAKALDLLTRLTGDDGPARLRRTHGVKLAAAVRDALLAVEAVHGTGTKAVRDWPERSRIVLDRLATLRAALDRSGVDDEVRPMVRALLEAIEPGPAPARRTR